MHKIKLVIYALFVFAFAVASIAIASQLKKDGFSISLPDGWVEIPRDAMDANEKELSRVAPNFPVQHLDHGFQLGSSKNWFEYPYISVKIQRTGRLPENELEKLEEYSAQKVYDKHKTDLSSMLSGVQSGKMIYDRQHRIIWTRLDVDIANIGPVSGISGMVLTEIGFIQVTGVSLRGDYPTYEAVFQSVALSVSPDPKLTYKSKWSDSLPPAVTGVETVLQTIVTTFVTIGLIYGFFRLCKFLVRMFGFEVGGRETNYKIKRWKSK